MFKNQMPNNHFEIKSKQTLDLSNLSKLFLYLLLVIFIISCSTSLKAKPVFKYRGKIKGVYHKVKKGQTLWRIAKTYNVNVKKIKRINRITNVRNIKTGAKLFIPGATRLLQVKPSIKKVSLDRRFPPVKKGFFIWPLKGKLTSKYGIRNRRKHDGIDIAAPKGSPIFASASGKVIFSGWGPTGYGKMVIIKHNRNRVTVYAHNSKNLVKKRERVKKGQKIAYVGSTGRASGPHLHFELRDRREPINPLKYLP